MTIDVNGAALQAALDKLATITVQHATIPILSHVALRMNGESLTLTTTDMDTRLEVILPAGGHLPATTISHRELTKYLALDDSPSVSIEAKDASATIRRGTVTATLLTLSAADFPHTKPIECNARFTVAGGPLLRALERVRSAMGQEATRYYLNGIYVCCQEDVLTLVATDGHRLIKEIVDVSIPTGWSGVIIPRAAIKSLIVLLADFSGDILFELDTSRPALRITVGGATLTTKAIDGTYPDYWRVIPGMDKVIATLDVDSCDLLRLARVLGDNRISHPVSFDLGPVVTLSIRDPSSGEVEIALSATYSGDAMRIGYQAKYIADMLAGVTGAVRFQFSGTGLNPTIITAEALPGWQGVLMPMRVS